MCLDMSLYFKLTYWKMIEVLILLLLEMNFYL